MSDAWTERLKVVKEIVLILVPLVTLLVSGATVKIASDVQTQQQENSRKIDGVTQTTDETKKAVDLTKKTVQVTATKVGATPPKD